MTESGAGSRAGSGAGSGAGMEHCRAVVHGRVQGVGFRFSTVDAAQRLGVTGWVRNLADGSVEAEFVGGPDAVDEMLAWLRIGPPSADVSGIQILERGPEAAENAAGAPGFVIR